MVKIRAAVEYIKKGSFATRITTHHLVRISRISIYLTVSLKKGFGLPIRNGDMAHDYKLAPVLDDNKLY